MVRWADREEDGRHWVRTRFCVLDVVLCPAEVFGAAVPVVSIKAGRFVEGFVPRDAPVEYVAACTQNKSIDLITFVHRC